MMEADRDWLKPYQLHGIEFGSSNDAKNFSADCPFTGKAGKFVVDRTTGMWQAFSAGKSGNIYTFLREMWEVWKSDTELADLAPLAKSKGLLISVLEDEVAFNRVLGCYVMPTRNVHGKIINISLYYLDKKRIFNTTYCPVGLIGAENMDPEKQGKMPVYICEGQWDRFALKWLLKSTRKKAVVLAVPGASVFKDAWVPYFRGRNVYLCYDHDTPGERGLAKATEYLQGTARKIMRLDWPGVLRDGYDVRDLINEQCGITLSRSKVDKAWSIFEKMFVEWDYSRVEENEPDEIIDVPTREEIESVFCKWIEMENLDAISILIGAVFANMIGGDPLWLMLVGPPGSAKTELLLSLSSSPRVETTGTLTPASLISAYRGDKGRDPSLLANLDSRYLVVKDLTALLNNQTIVRDEVMGILRDAYDGIAEKAFSFGKKSFQAHFGLFAGVTEIIDSYTGVASALGERFLRYRMPRGTSDQEDRKIMRAMANVDQERSMRRELQDIMRRYLEKPLPSKLPTLTAPQTRRILSMAKYVAKMRGAVHRDRFSAEILSIPSIELGTRVSKQLHKQAQGLAIHFGLNEVDDNCIRLCGKLAVDTPPAIQEMLVRLIYQETQSSPDRGVGQSWMARQTGLSQSTISRRMEDLIMVGAIQKTRGEQRVSSLYRVHADLESLIRQAGIYPENPQNPQN